MGPEEMRAVAGLFARALDTGGEEGGLEAVKREVVDLASGFPVPGITDRASVTA
jgi:glycine/serine hydroxymethyltransferase